MDHIDEMTQISHPEGGYEQDIQEIIEKMEQLTISDYPLYVSRKKGRPKECFTDEDKANRQREYSKRYYYKNQEHVLNRIRAYKDANQDMIKEKAKEYYHRKKQSNFFLYFFSF